MKYIMIWPYGWFDTYMYRDLTTDNIVYPININVPYSSRIINFLHRVHYSHKINHFVNLPCKDVWNKNFYKSVSVEIENNTCIIFDTGALTYLSLHMLRKMKHLGKDVKMVLLIVDSLHGSSAHIPDAFPKIFGFQWDCILSYDKNDCNEFGFDYLGQSIYSKLDNLQPSNEKSDLYFIGRNKAGRNQDVIKLYNAFYEAGLDLNFNLVDKRKNIEKYKTKYTKSAGLHLYSDNLPYEKVISDVLSTNCILEVVAPGQKVQTARYYEAVCYNKKLLTNNIGFSELPFYDSKYIRYFECIDDIDFDWIKDTSPVEYNYHGEFSPVHLLDTINNRLMRC